MGNIYADEALFRAGIHPLRPAGRLSSKQHADLRGALIDALQAGIDARGASIDDFRHPDGVRGSFQDRFLVHLRAGEPCGRCGRAIIKTVVAGRGTYVCERCQPRPRTPARRARPAPRAPAPGEQRLGGEQVVQPAAVGRRLDLGKAADQPVADEHLRKAHHARSLYELRAPGRIL